MRRLCARGIRDQHVPNSLVLMETNSGRHVENSNCAWNPDDLINHFPVLLP